LRRNSFANKQFGEWLSNELRTKKIAITELASVSEVGSYAIHRMRKGQSAPAAYALQVVSALGYSEERVAEILRGFEFKGPMPSLVIRETHDHWKFLCVALQLLGDYPSVEVALKRAIAREVFHQQTKQPQVPQ
jgi:hypothetical protein